MWKIRVRLWITSYKQTKKWCSKQSLDLNDVYFLNKESLLRLVNAASFLVPHATCLTKALTAHTVLKQYNYENMLYVGVKKKENSTFEAHAWLQDKDKNIIFGGDFSSSFKPIMIEE